MGSKTKKIKAAGRFGSRAGMRVRNRLNALEALQRKKQFCPHCSKRGAKRLSAGIWYCARCKRTFAGSAYMLQAQI